MLPRSLAKMRVNGHWVHLHYHVPKVTVKPIEPQLPLFMIPVLKFHLTCARLAPSYTQVFYNDGSVLLCVGRGARHFLWF